jgi:hypothetical protein
VVFEQRLVGDGRVELGSGGGGRRVCIATRKKKGGYMLDGEKRPLVSGQIPCNIPLISRSRCDPTTPTRVGRTNWMTPQGRGYSTNEE